MKLNNRGVSLIELLVSIVLIGIVLIFLFQLIVDLKNETNNNDFAFNNQVNRTEAIYTIQNDLNNYTLIAVEEGSDTENLKINFIYKKGTGTITAVLSTATSTSKNALGDTITTHYLKYYSVDNVSYSWEMKGAEIDHCGLFTYYIDTISNNYYFKLNLYLYNSVYHERNNKDKNNVIDDIEITYAGLKDNLENNTPYYLTNTNKGYKNVGHCGQAPV